MKKYNGAYVTIYNFKKLIPGVQNGILFYNYKKIDKRFKFKIKFWNNHHNHNGKPIGKWRYTIFIGPIHIKLDNSSFEIGTHSKHLCIFFK